MNAPGGLLLFEPPAPPAMDGPSVLVLAAFAAGAVARARTAMLMACELDRER